MKPEQGKECQLKWQCFSIFNEDEKMKIELTPSPNGEKCISNGQHEGMEIACDECDFFLECYPNSEQFDKPDFKNEI